MLRPFLRMTFPFMASVLFCLWWGGLMFYAAVVVPVGGQVIGVTEQGAVTASVTFWLNCLGTMNVISLAAFLYWPSLLGRKVKEAFPTLDSLNRKQSDNAKWIVVSTLAVAQFLLWLLSFRLYQEFDSSRILFRDQDVFYFWHRIYLWVTMVQMWGGLWWLGMVCRIFPDDRGTGM